MALVRRARTFLFCHELIAASSILQRKKNQLHFVINHQSSWIVYDSSARQRHQLLISQLARLYYKSEKNFVQKCSRFTCMSKYEGNSRNDECGNCLLPIQNTVQQQILEKVSSFCTLYCHPRLLLLRPPPPTNFSISLSDWTTISPLSLFASL